MGKKHGGLSHIGKVKAQTPQVPKATKAKKPKGRALKRAQYNKRIIVGEGVTKNPNKQNV